MQETITDLNEELEQKVVDMENLQEAATHLEVVMCFIKNKVATYQEEYSKLKNFTQNLAENEMQN